MSYPHFILEKRRFYLLFHTIHIFLVWKTLWIKACGFFFVENSSEEERQKQKFQELSTFFAIERLWKTGGEEERKESKKRRKLCCFLEMKAIKLG